MTENEVSFITRGAIFKVFKTLGPGLLESVYEAALSYQLMQDGLEVKTQVPIPVIYGDKKLDVGFRLDVVVENKIVVEIKSVESLHEVHHKQLLTYLRISKMKLGLLVNFNTTDIAKTIFRKVNGL
jgi:GxxExxY protein